MYLLSETIENPFFYYYFIGNKKKMRKTINDRLFEFSPFFSNDMLIELFFSSQV